MKCIASICDKIATVSSVCIVLCVIALGAPLLFGLRPYVTLSGSMEPEIPVASLAYIDTHDVTPEIGKVVAYHIASTDGDSIPVTHRIIDKKEGGYVTKGDNNDAEDMILLKPENIIGTYKYSIPLVGYVMAKKTVFLMLIVFWIMGFRLLSILFSNLAD